MNNKFIPTQEIFDIFNKDVYKIKNRYLPLVSENHEDSSQVQTSMSNYIQQCIDKIEMQIFHAQLTKRITIILLFILIVIAFPTILFSIVGITNVFYTINLSYIWDINNTIIYAILYMLLCPILSISCVLIFIIARSRKQIYEENV